MSTPKRRWWQRKPAANTPELAAPPSAQRRYYGPPCPEPQWRSVIDQQIRNHRVTVSQLKGGVGKTTTVMGLGTALALYRRDTTTTIDTNPHRGTLAERVGVEHAHTVQNLLENVESIQSMADYRRFTSQAVSRMEVLAADKDPDKSKLLTPEEYETALQIATTFRSVVITDTGTDLTMPLMSKIYETTDTLVVPAPAAADGFTLAKETLDWWERKAPNGPDLVRNAVVVFIRNEGFTLDPSNPPSAERLAELMHEWEQVQTKRERTLIEQLSGRVRAVVTVPYDPTLRIGHLFVWEKLNADTRDAFTHVAYEVAMGFKSTPLNTEPVQVPVNAIGSAYDTPRRGEEPAQPQWGNTGQQQWGQHPQSSPQPGTHPQQQQQGWGQQAPQQPQQQQWGNTQQGQQQWEQQQGQPQWGNTQQGQPQASQQQWEQAWGTNTPTPQPGQPGSPATPTNDPWAPRR